MGVTSFVKDAPSFAKGVASFAKEAAPFAKGLASFSVGVAPIAKDGASLADDVGMARVPAGALMIAGRVWFPGVVGAGAGVVLVPREFGGACVKVGDGRSPTFAGSVERTGAGLPWTIGEQEAMPLSSESFTSRVESLKADLVKQGRRVQAMVETSFDAIFAGDVASAKKAEVLDQEIDSVDVALEKAAVALLTEACQQGANLEPNQVRMVLTIVKVNNELERIADIGVAIAEEIAIFRQCAQGAGAEPPMTFRVLANSSIGVLRDSVGSLDRMDAKLAKMVLMSETAVGAFKAALVKDIQQQVHARTMPLDLASALHDTAMFCVHIADHCTNIAEQVMYVSTGTIVRHMQGRWEEIKLPG